MKNYKLSMTTDILAPRIKHLTSENKALKNKVKQLEGEKSEIYDLLVGENGVKRYTHQEMVIFIVNQFDIIDIPDDEYQAAWFEFVRDYIPIKNRK